MIFDSDGNLVLPRGARMEFSNVRRRMRPRATGVFVVCPRCGNAWERRTRSAGTLRCYACNNKVEVEEIE